MAEAPYVVHRTIGPLTDRRTLRFEWHGGQYVDVREKGRSTVSEVINVWKGDDTTIERTQSALAAEVDRWIENYSEGGTGEFALYHDVTHAWRV